MSWNWNVNHRKRLENALETGFESDLTLVVGAEREEFKVHKFLLMIASPVLHQKIKRMASNGTKLEFPNEDPCIFKRVLEYLYTGNITPNFSESLPLLNLSSEFEILELVSQCARIIRDNFSEGNILDIFQRAKQSGHNDLVNSALLFICTNARSVLVQDEFACLPENCLLEIIQNDQLQVAREIDVFHAVVRWGRSECTRRGLDSMDAVQMRTVLAQALRFVRFPLMDQQEFALHVAAQNLLPMEELVQLLLCYSLPLAQRTMQHGRYSSVSRQYIPYATPVITPRSNPVQGQNSMSGSSSGAIGQNENLVNAMRGFSFYANNK